MVQLFLLSSTYSNLRAFAYIFKHLVYTRRAALAVRRKDSERGLEKVGRIAFPPVTL